MAEWSIAAVLKTVEGNTSGGSNPSLSAKAFWTQFQKAFFISPKQRARHSPHLITKPSVLIMKLSEIKNNLLTTLSPLVLNDGFKPNKTLFCLKRDDKNNECQFSFDHNSWSDEIHLLPYVQIKNKMIHSICEANDFHLNYTAFINLLLLKKIYNGTYTEDSRWQMQYNQQDRFVIHNDSISKKQKQKW